MARILLLFILATLPLPARETASLIRIDFSQSSKSQVERLLGMNLDITYIDRHGGQMDAIVTADQLQTIQAHAVVTTPVIPDLQSYEQQLRDANYFSHFHSFDQILNELQQVVQHYPHIAELHDIGDSYLKQTGQEGYDVWALKLSDDVANDDTTEAEILYMANMHAREIITPEIILYFMHYLVDHYEDDPFVTHLINHRELWLIPTLNPDGHDYVFQGDIADRYRYPSYPLWWRKNMRDNNEDGEFDPGIDGVDLNRNFGYMWGLDDEGSSDEMSSETYRGTAAFSEPETQIIRDFVQQRNFIISLSYHSYSNLWLYPWGYTAEPVESPDYYAFKALADSCVFYNNYVAQSGADLYLVNGCSDDWLYAEEGIYAFTPEVGNRNDNFFPDTTRILPLILENLGPNLFMAYAAGEEPVVNHLRMPDVEEPQAQYTFQTTITPPIVLTDSVALDTSRFKLYYRSQESAEFLSEDLSYSDSTETFVAQIPGDDLQGSIYYYFEAYDFDGRRGTSPRAAPMAVDSFFVNFDTNVHLAQTVPASFELRQNYPNPFNASTRISFQIPQQTAVTLQIFDIYGRHVKTLSQGTFSEGTHVVTWDGTNTGGIEVASGVFYCRMQTPFTRHSIKLLYLK